MNAAKTVWAIVARATIRRLDVERAKRLDGGGAQDQVEDVGRAGAADRDLVGARLQRGSPPAATRADAHAVDDRTEPARRVDDGEALRVANEHAVAPRDAEGLAVGQPQAFVGHGRGTTNPPAALDG